MFYRFPEIIADLGDNYNYLDVIEKINNNGIEYDDIDDKILLFKKIEYLNERINLSYFKDFTKEQLNLKKVIYGGDFDFGFNVLNAYLDHVNNPGVETRNIYISTIVGHESESNISDQEINSKLKEVYSEKKLIDEYIFEPLTHKHYEKIRMVLENAKFCKSNDIYPDYVLDNLASFFKETTPFGVNKNEYFIKTKDDYCRYLDERLHSSIERTINERKAKKTNEDDPEKYEKRTDKLIERLRKTEKTLRDENRNTTLNQKIIRAITTIHETMKNQNNEFFGLNIEDDESYLSVITNIKNNNNNTYDDYLRTIMFMSEYYENLCDDQMMLNKKVFSKYMNIMPGKFLRKLIIEKKQGKVFRLARFYTNYRAALMKNVSISEINTDLNYNNFLNVSKDLVKLLGSENIVVQKNNQDNNMLENEYVAMSKQILATVERSAEIYLSNNR